MKISQRLCLAALVLLVGFYISLSVEAEPNHLRLLGRSDVDGYHVVLDEADWRWLRDKKTLLLGVSVPDYPPFEMVVNDSELEGITSDFAVLIGQLLHVNIEVRRYGSRQELVAAVKSGEVDFLGTSNEYEASDPLITMSHVYADDKPTLISLKGNSSTLPPDLAGKKIAMLYHYQSPEAVRAFYPKATLQLYPSMLSAIGAVSFGQADVYLGDAISANYVINKNFLNSVQLADFSRMEVRNFSFALNRNSQRLLRIINSTMDVIAENERMTIMRRWSSGGASIPGQHRLHFSVNEQQWLDRHPRLRVVIDENLPPLSFYNSKDEFVGIAADVLAKVAFRAGLNFEVQRVKTVSELIERIKTDKADLVITLPPSAEREGALRFTRPYLNTPFVMVSRLAKDSPRSLDEMTGKRLVIVHGSAISDFIKAQYPGVQLFDAGSSSQALSMVADGEVDAAVDWLLSARYAVFRNYNDRLQVVSTVGTFDARMAFATDRGSLELYSILDKTLLSIPPEEMDEVTNRWRNELISEDSYWVRKRTLIIQVFSVAMVVLIFALCWIGYMRFIIYRRDQAERALSHQLEFMRVLIDGTPHPIYVRDWEGRLLMCNAAYLNAFGVKRENVIGKTVLEGPLHEPNEAKAYHDDYLQVMALGSPLVQDRRLTMAKDSVLTIYHWMLPYRGTDGKVAGMIAGWIDISERQRLMAELLEAKELADDANRAKTTFLATMSHEIRTPMNAVIGMLELAIKKADKGVMDRFAIEVASGAAHGLLDLIGDILDIARIESGRLSLAPERASLRDLVESVLRVFEGLARQKHLSLALDLDFKASRDVLVDPVRFKQILSNLLSNAIKFTTAGEVRLSVLAEFARDNQRLKVNLEIEDTGIGISIEDQQRLFSPFTQASNNLQSARSGSGLGLMISRTLCEMMGGQLLLHSVVGKGTRINVSLDLPVLEPIAELSVQKDEPITHNYTLNILVVDDYPANRLLLSQQLSYLGHRVIDAEDGAHGLRAWRGQHFDVVITDCNMPIMNGYELAGVIRREELAKAIQPSLILGFTANAQPDERGRCIGAGMDDCLFKPISLQDLSARLATVIPVAQAVMHSDQSELSEDIDLTSLEQLTRGDSDSIKALLGDLLISIDEDMARLIQLFSNHDLTGLSDLAHRVKGGARIIKAHALIQYCENLEVICSGYDASGLTEAVDVLQNAMERLSIKLNIYIG